MTKKLPVVLFSQQDQWFALEAKFIGGQGSSLLYNTNTLLLPFEQFLTAGVSQKNNFTHWLRLAAKPTATKPWLLGIENEAELIELSAAQIHPLPPLLLARRTFPALQAVAWYQQRLVSLIDARVLLKLAPPLLASLTPDANQV